MAMLLIQIPALKQIPRRISLLYIGFRSRLSLLSHALSAGNADGCAPGTASRAA